MARWGKALTAETDDPVSETENRLSGIVFGPPYTGCVLSLCVEGVDGSESTARGESLINKRSQLLGSTFKMGYFLTV